MTAQVRFEVIAYYATDPPRHLNELIVSRVSNTPTSAATWRQAFVEMFSQDKRRVAIEIRKATRMHDAIDRPDPQIRRVTLDRLEVGGSIKGGSLA